MKMLPALASFALISACASTQEVLSKGPDEIVESTRSQGDVVFCLANKNSMPVLDGPNGGKLVLLKNSYGAVGVTFTVYPQGTGSRIEIRRAIPLAHAIHRQCY